MYECMYVCVCYEYIYVYYVCVCVYESPQLSEREAVYQTKLTEVTEWFNHELDADKARYARYVYVCACVYVCTYVHMCVCVYVCVRVCMYITHVQVLRSLSLYVNLCTNINFNQSNHITLHTRPSTHTHTYTYRLTHTQTHTHTYRLTHTNTHIYIQTHTHKHTHTQ